jgi:phospholipase/carboxylesterase
MDPVAPTWPLPVEWLPAAGAAEQLVLMFAGWGGDGAAMAPLAQALRAQFPQAALLAPSLPATAPEAEDAPLDAWVRAQQHRLGVPPPATCLAGFGEGAVLALSLALRHDGLAGRVLSFAGRLGELPAAAPRLTTIHFFHGAADSAVPAQQSRWALEHLGALGGDATLDIASGVGHALHPALLDCALHRLTHHIPHRTGQAALGGLPPDAEPH